MDLRIPPKGIVNKSTPDLAKKTAEISTPLEPEVDVASTTPEKPYARLELESQIRAVNNVLEASKSSVKFTLHEKLDQYYVQIIDDNTKEVIKEIPSKKMMDIVAHMFKSIGLLIDKKW